MKYTRADLSKKSVAKLKEIAFPMAVKYYTSEDCHISFGNTKPEEAALMLLEKASKTSLVKDILSLQKRIA